MADKNENLLFIPSKGFIRKMNPSSARKLKPVRPPPPVSQAVPFDDTDLLKQLKSRVINQDSTLEKIVDYVDMFKSGLSVPGRPIANFMLMGPTGSGKTHSPKMLAECLHGSPKNCILINCGEFIENHEVAKLIGAPPGYLGHRETTPMLTQIKLSSVASERSPISIVIFDEVEKAAPSLARLLLGILEGAELKLGDGNTVNFSNSFIFMTSNIGMREVSANLDQSFNFAREPRKIGDSAKSHAMRALKRQYAPEFVNRIDEFMWYPQLSNEGAKLVLARELVLLELFIFEKLGVTMTLSEDVQALLLAEGYSDEYGARELKRTLRARLTVPLSKELLAGRIRRNKEVLVNLEGDTITFTEADAVIGSIIVN